MKTFVEFLFPLFLFICVVHCEDESLGGKITDQFVQLIIPTILGITLLLIAVGTCCCLGTIISLIVAICISVGGWILYRLRRGNYQPLGN
jgi:hypothetical protein